MEKFSWIDFAFWWISLRLFPKRTKLKLLLKALNTSEGRKLLVKAMSRRPIIRPSGSLPVSNKELVESDVEQSNM